MMELTTKGVVFRKSQSLPLGKFGSKVPWKLEKAICIIMLFCNAALNSNFEIGIYIPSGLYPINVCV